MRRLYAATAVALCVAAAVAIVVLLVVDSEYAPANLGYTAGSLLIFGLTAASGLSAVGGYPLAWAGWLCVLVSVTGLGLTMGVVWSTTPEGEASEGLIKSSASLFFFSFALAAVCVTLVRLRTDDSRLVRTAVVAALLSVLGVATLLTVAVIDDISADAYFRITAVVAVMAALATALTPVLRAGRRA